MVELHVEVKTFSDVTLELIKHVCSKVLSSDWFSCCGVLGALGSLVKLTERKYSFFSVKYLRY